MSVDAAVRVIRRGLPRVPGGEAWPVVAQEFLASSAVSLPDAGGSVAPVAVPAAAVAGPAAGLSAEVRVSEAPAAGAAGAAAAGPARAGTAPLATAGHTARRGLPRVVGGEGWPPAGTTIPERFRRAIVEAAAPVATSAPAEQTPSATTSTVSASEQTARRGLPRISGGEPWPPAGTVVPERFRRAAVEAAAPDAPTLAETTPVASASPDSAVVSEAAATLAATNATPVSPAPATQAAPAATRAASPATAVVQPASAPKATGGAKAGTAVGEPKTPAKKERPEPKRYGKYTAAQWAGVGVLGVVGVLVVAGILVLAARGLTTFESVRNFLAKYPGEYHLPESAPVGLPAWVGWQHFLNVFLMVLIIRSGLQVRRQERPPAYFTPKRAGGKKISLSLWLHQSLDVLWMVNGLVFVVLLFATGQWMRVIPTSWEVFPNALSAALQYATLEWPAENGWVNYNALQQLAYGATIFIAAPLAALTGWRMSGLWPSKAKKLSAAYKVEWARAVHFPTMLYFVGFIAVHVILVVSTGVLRNLNHMFAATDGHGWTGFWFFAGSLVVIAAAVAAARPLVLAPIARLFGTVTAR